MSELRNSCFRGIQDEFQNLVDAHDIRETAPAKPPTLLQIAGFPHWENVYSNILAFFLDSDGAHGFGPLFIRSLMAAYCCKCGQDGGLKDVPFPDAVEAGAAVEREVRTSDDKRIDLVVDCAEFRVCIENKIWASLYNDLAHYREHCESESDGRPVLGIVLSPEAVTDQDGLKTLEAQRFVNITYEDLVKQVHQRMGSHIGPHNMRYQYLLFDFLEQASRLRTTHMNDDEQAFLDFWKENDPKISNLEEWTKRMWDLLDAKAKAKDHIERCIEKLEKNEREVFKDWIYHKRVAVFDLAEGGTIEGHRIFLDVEFHPLRVTHVLGDRRGSAPTAFANKIKDRCDTKSLEFHIRPDRVEFATEASPFDGRVCKEAVDRSVRILKYIAERRNAEKT